MSDKEQLELRLLTADELSLWCDDLQAAQDYFGLRIDAEAVEGHLKWVFEQKIGTMRRDPGNDLWYSYFAIIYQKIVIGTIGAKGKPDADGAIEVGYGIHEPYWNRGIMTRVVADFCRYFFENTDIRSIVAETEADNWGSQQVLRKNRFQQEAADSALLRWRLTRA